MQPSGSARRDGFTLLEVLVAVVILGVAVVAWLGTFGSELRMLGRASEVTTAAALAEERMGSIRLLASDRLPDLPDSLKRGSFPTPFDGYQWVAESKSVVGRDLAELSVTVEGPDARRRLTTLVPVQPLTVSGRDRP